MARLCQSRKTRREAFTTKQPTEWKPSDAIDAATQQPCTLDGSWRMVEAYLLGTGAIKAVLLKRPPGRTGYWFHMYDHDGNRIYVKLQMGSGLIFGRSFHLG